MSIFDSINQAGSVQEVEKDSLGGGGFTLDTGLYNFIIESAFLGKSAGGAASVTLNFKDSNDNKLKEVIYVTSGDAKGNKTTYERDGKQFNMPGFNQVNSLCQLVTGKPFAGISPPEKKTIKLYDFNAGAEVLTEVEMLMDLVGQPITAGVFKVRKNKQAKSAQSGQYENTYDDNGNPVLQERNELNKCFRASDGLTIAEIAANATECVFRNKWDAEKTGKVQDDRKLDLTPRTGGAVAGAPVSAEATAQASSLFK